MPSRLPPPAEHNPRFVYDCRNCKFNWCCGPCCSCLLRREPVTVMPEPPWWRRYQVNAAQKRAGLVEEYNLDGTCARCTTVNPIPAPRRSK